jgi:hypothetical protein
VTPDKAPRYTDDETDVVLPRPYDDFDPETGAGGNCTLTAGIGTKS